MLSQMKERKQATRKNTLNYISSCRVCRGETREVLGLLTAPGGFHLSQELLIVSAMLSTLHPCSGSMEVKKGSPSARFYGEQGGVLQLESKTSVGL